MRKPPFTEAERAYFKGEIEKWERTGYGINPNQDALRHYPKRTYCGCHFCAGTPIQGTYPSSSTWASWGLSRRRG